MKFLQNMKKKKANNKGFSLVELIIVIAIMAILVGIVGSQVVPYLEKSRKAKDIQILSAWCTDAMSAYSSNAANLDAADVYTITITNGAVEAKNSDNKANTVLAEAFCELNDTTTAAGYKFVDKMESKAGKSISTVTIKCCDPSSEKAAKENPKLENIITLTVSTSDAKYTFDTIKSN